MKALYEFAFLFALLSVSHGFTPPVTSRSAQVKVDVSQMQANMRPSDGSSRMDRHQFLERIALSFSVAIPLSLMPQPSQASEIGVEVEAPTLYTGESVMV